MLIRMKNGTGLAPDVLEKAINIELQHRAVRYMSTLLLRTNMEINAVMFYALHTLQYPLMG